MRENAIEKFQCSNNLYSSTRKVMAHLEVLIKIAGVCTIVAHSTVSPCTNATGAVQKRLGWRTFCIQELEHSLEQQTARHTLTRNALLEFLKNCSGSTDKQFKAVNFSPPTRPSVQCMPDAHGSFYDVDSLFH